MSFAHLPGNDYRFIDRKATIFVTVVALGRNRKKAAMGQLSQRSGLSGNAVVVTVALFRTLVFLWEVPTVTGIGRVWDAILVTVDGFGGLTCEPCKHNLYGHTDRASLGRDPRDR